MSKLDDLEAKARAATPGPWREGSVDRDCVFCPATHPERMSHERVLLRMNGHFPHEADAAFIAAANPATALALIEAVRAAEALLDSPGAKYGDHATMTACKELRAALAKLEGKP